MFMRINGNKNWCKVRNFNLHGRKQNEIKVLHDFEPEVATAMMTSPVWTKAAIFREPKERVLSAFLDKAVKEDYYVRKCCKNLPTDKLQQQCINNEEKFESFLYFVTEYPDECFDIHWEPQIAKIDAKWWPYIDVIGYIKTDKKRYDNDAEKQQNNQQDQEMNEDAGGGNEEDMDQALNQEHDTAFTEEQVRKFKELS